MITLRQPNNAQAATALIIKLFISSRSVSTVTIPQLSPCLVGSNRCVPNPSEWTRTARDTLEHRSWDLCVRSVQHLEQFSRPFVLPIFLRTSQALHSYLQKAKYAVTGRFCKSRKIPWGTSVQWHDCGLDDRNSIPGRGKDCSLFHRRLWSLPNPMAMGVLSPGGKAAGPWSWLLTSEVMNPWRYTSTPTWRSAQLRTRDLSL